MSATPRVLVATPFFEMSAWSGIKDVCLVLTHACHEQNHTTDTEETTNKIDLFEDL